MICSSPDKPKRPNHRYYLLEKELKPVIIKRKLSNNLVFRLFIHNFANENKKPFDGQDDKGAAPPLHGSNKKQGNTPRNYGAKVSLCPRIPLSSQPSPTPRPSRHSTPKIPYRYFCQRMFLARTQLLPKLQRGVDQHRLLGKENPSQQTTRHRGTTTNCIHGMALHNDMGMSAKAPLPTTNP